MKWSNFTGLSPETSQDRMKIRYVNRKVLEGMGRSCVVWLLAFNIVFSLPDEMAAELSRTIAVAGFEYQLLLLEPIILGAVAWSLAPLLSGLYALLMSVSEAKTDV